MKQAEVYENDVLLNTKGKTLAAHGLAIHFNLITPPKGVDVNMVALKDEVMWYAVV